MTDWKILAFLTLAVLLAIAFSGADVSAGTVGTKGVPEYVVGEGDTLHVAVWGTKDFDVVVKVRPDGKITLPAIGDVSASGVTPSALQSILTEKVRSLIKNPLVTVTVQEVTNSKAYIFGGGVTSAVYNLDRRTTLLQLLCVVAGAKTEKGNPAAVADFRRAYLLRNGERIKENFHDLFIKGKVEDDVAIQADDALFIPEASEKYVYVVGAVNAPRVLDYREGMTVMQAILEAGGYSKFASENSTTIVRKQGDKETEIHVRGKKLIRDGDLKENQPLVAGDFVIIGESFF